MRRSAASSADDQLGGPAGDRCANKEHRLSRYGWPHYQREIRYSNVQSSLYDEIVFKARPIDKPELRLEPIDMLFFRFEN